MGVVFVYYFVKILDAEYDEDWIDWAEIDTRLFEVTKIARSKFSERKPLLELDTLSGGMAEVFLSFFSFWTDDEADLKEIYEKEIPKLLLENVQIEVQEIDHVGVY